MTRAVVSGTSTVVGRAAAGFFEDRIALIRTDRAAFAAALREDTAAQIVTSGADLDAITARRLEAVGDGRGYVNAARAMQAMHAAPLTGALGQLRCPVDVIGATATASARARRPTSCWPSSPTAHTTRSRTAGT